MAQQVRYPQYKINRRPMDDKNDQKKQPKQIKKEESKTEYTPHVQAVLDSIFPTEEVMFESAEEAAAYQSTQLDDNIDLTFTSYHAQSSDLKQVFGKKACYDYFLNDYWKAWGFTGFVTKHHKVEITEYEDGSTVLFLAVDYIFIDKDKKRRDPWPGTNRLELNKDGLITRFISYSQAFDIASLIRKKYLLKALDENKDDNKDNNMVNLICFDEEFNKVKFEMDKEKEKSKLKQIRQIIKEGEEKRKDVLIIVIQPTGKNGKALSTIVSHAIAQ